MSENQNPMTTLRDSLLEDFFPRDWDFTRIDTCVSTPDGKAGKHQPWWHRDFLPVPCAALKDLNVMMGHEIASAVRRSQVVGKPLVLILPVGPMGMCKWAVDFHRKWGVPASHVLRFNMDEWSDAEGNTLPRSNPGSFKYAMEQAFYDPLGELTVPPAQRNIATPSRGRFSTCDIRNSTFFVF